MRVKKAVYTHALGVGLNPNRELYFLLRVLTHKQHNLSRHSNVYHKILLFNVVINPRTQEPT